MAHYDEGTHTCTIHSHGIDKSPNKGTPYVFLRFTPQGGEYERDVKLWLTDKTVGRAIEILRGLGWTGDRFADLGRHSFAGKVVELTCKHTHSNGTDYEDWEFPRPATASEPATTDDSVARKLDALFGRELKKSAPAKPTETPAAADDEAGDDIPF